MWEAVGWRLANWDTPLWVNPNRRAGRYNAAGSDATQYLCLHPWGPWAELLRWEDRRTVTDAVELRGRIWAIRVLLANAPKRITFDEAATAGITAEDLVTEDHAACQRVAAVLRRHGEQALIVPSAALPGTENLVLLGPRVMISWQATPVDADLDVPAAVGADRAGPPLAVLDYVRWRHSAHRALTAWHAGRPVEFSEPVPTPL